MIKNVLIVIALIVGFIVISQAISTEDTAPTTKQCDPGTTLVEYENGDRQKPICKGVPIKTLEV